MAGSKITITVSRTAGLTLLNHGVVSLAMPRTEDGRVKGGIVHKSARRVLGDVVDTPGFALAEVIAGAALVLVVPRMLRR
ncbi:hypothetical protein [uncultured Demequina sp.]|uniref:hypothetical protein n=1 Tax=uncultured Demequina sp. TaxID=693499 RepID=UPI0025F8FD0F|nr:hypothetical protein [uncultured Demequina sp.]